MSAIQEVADRYTRYCEAEISKNILPHDDMLVAGDMDHYMNVGRSAVDVIVSALVATGNPTIRTILDLPCGGGRVTRHLCSLFPASKIFVSDLDRQKEDFVATTMKVTRAESSPNFVDDPARQYDLIFVGSLVTHLNAAMFRRAEKWFIRALAPNGLLIVTTHGRRHNHLLIKIHSLVNRLKLRFRYKIAGFGFAAPRNNPSYGGNLSSPSWVIGLIEKEPSAKIVAFHEAGWDNNPRRLSCPKN
jgi:SAM-dependent methyltransferase